MSRRPLVPLWLLFAAFMLMCAVMFGSIVSQAKSVPPTRSVTIDRMENGVYNVWTMHHGRWMGRTVDTETEALTTAARILRSDFTAP